MQKQIERRSAEEGDRCKASKDRLEKLEKELADLEEQSAALTARWQAEKDKLEAGTRKLKEQLDRGPQPNWRSPSARATWPRRASWPMAPSPSWRSFGLKEAEAGGRQ